MDKGKKDNIVESIIDAEASSVSLLSCEDRTKIAVDAGRAKKIIPALKGTPVILKAFNNTNPVTGKIINLKNDARNEILVLAASPLKERDPPMEISARGRVTDVMRLKVLFKKTGKTNPDREKKSPARHPMIKGLDNKALIMNSIFSLKLTSLPECHIRVDTAKTLIIGIKKPINIPKCLTPASPRVFMIMAIPR